MPALPSTPLRASPALPIAGTSFTLWRCSLDIVVPRFPREMCCAVLRPPHPLPLPGGRSGASVSSVVHTQPVEFSVGESTCGGQSPKGAVARQGRVHPPVHPLLWVGCVGPASRSLSHPCCPPVRRLCALRFLPRLGVRPPRLQGAAWYVFSVGWALGGSHPLAQLPRPHHPLSQAVKSPGSCGLLWGLGSVPSPHLAASSGQDLQGGALWKP